MPMMKMVHKDFSDREPTSVEKKAFEKIWKEKGWVEAKDEAKEEDEKASSTTSPTSPSTSSSKDK